MIWGCRILLLISWSLFWGGLTFYTGFVVRVSHDVLSDSMDGGMITQRITVLLQWLGVVSCSLMVWNAIVVRRRDRWYGNVLLSCVCILAFSLAGLFVVHGHLDGVIDTNTAEITDRESFTIGHRRYNQLTTTEWLSSLIYLPVTVFAWRQIDRQHSGD